MHKNPPPPSGQKFLVWKICYDAVRMSVDRNISRP